MGFEIDTGRTNLPYRAVIYGPEGIGKTSLAARFPEPLFSDTEGSTLRFDGIRRLKPRPENWATLIQQAEYVRDHPEICQTYVIDTADWAERMCQRAVCDRAKKAGIEDFGYGKGYTYAAEEFGRLLNILTEIQQRGVHVVLTAHAAMRKFEQPDEMGAYDRWEMKMHKSVCAMTKEWADLVLFVNYKTYVVAADDAGKRHKAQGGARVVYTAHNPCWDAKNRFGMPEELPLEYEAIAKYLQLPRLESQRDSKSGQRPDRPGQIEDLSGAPSKAAPVQAAPVQAAPAPATPAPATPAPVTSAPAAPAPSAPKKPEEAPQKPKEAPQKPLPAAPAPAPGEPVDGLWAGIPEPLARLMRANDVLPEEIMYIVSDQKGYYPSGTPIRNYAPDFIDGWAIGMWDKVLAAVKENREADPF